MTDQTTIDQATRRLTQALDTLDATVDQRIEFDRAQARLAEQVYALETDRAKLAADLDVELARRHQLEAASKEIAQRLDVAMESIAEVLNAQDQ